MQINITKKPFYRWIIVLSGLLITGGGIGIFNNCLSVFVKPVCEDLGFARSQFTLYSTISMLASALSTPVYGSLFTKFGVKPFMIMSALVCGLVPLGYSMSSALWQFYALALVNGLFVNGVNFMAAGTLIGAWFKEKKGIATGIAYAGSGLVPSIMLPIMGRIIEQSGWRWAYRLMGLSGMAILIPTILLLVKSRPEDIGLGSYTTDEAAATIENKRESVGLTRAQALKTPTFWFLTMGILAITLCAGGPHTHTVSYLTDIGYSTTYAASVMSFYMVMLTIGKLLLGMIFDRFGALAGSLFVGTCCLIVPVLALMAGIPAIPWVLAAVLGFSNSGSSVPATSLTAKYFGDKEFPAIFSLCTMASTLGGALSPPVMGAIYDVTGSYIPAWYIAIGYACIVLVCLLMANRTSRSLSTADDLQAEATQ